MFEIKKHYSFIITTNVKSIVDEREVTFLEDIPGNILCDSHSCTRRWVHCPKPHHQPCQGSLAEVVGSSEARTFTIHYYENAWCWLQSTPLKKTMVKIYFQFALSWVLPIIKNKNHLTGGPKGIIGGQGGGACPCPLDRLLSPCWRTQKFGLSIKSFLNLDIDRILRFFPQYIM